MNIFRKSGYLFNDYSIYDSIMKCRLVFNLTEVKLRCGILLNVCLNSYLA